MRSYPAPGSVQIRPESPQDHEAVGDIVAAAFDGHDESRLVELIRASPHYIAPLALVAEHAGEVVGHVMISEARLVTSAGPTAIHLLAPLAVAPAMQHRGIGSALTDAVCLAAASQGAPVVALEGDPAYYGRLGFVAASQFGVTMPLPDWAAPECAQLRWLTSPRMLGGHIEYPEAFSAFSAEE